MPAHGWAGRTRTFECQVQSLVPYQLGDRPASSYAAGHDLRAVTLMLSNIPTGRELPVR